MSRSIAPGIGVLCLLAACAARTTTPTTAPAASAPALPAAAPRTTAADPDSIRWVRDSAEHDALFLQVYGEAASRVESLAAARKPGTWAVVLDADETVISNMIYQQERARLGLPYSADSWKAWVQRREATALPGAAAFLTRVRALGGRIAIVTNRLGSECADTEAVFAAQMLVYDAMLCRSDGSPSDKNPRFEAVAGGRSPASPAPVEIVAFIGDNILDFPGLAQARGKAAGNALQDFGTRFFMLPNPMYGSWQ
jgi:5'-nucleotidase (lipoprotein e(P4) family)